MKRVPPSVRMTEEVEALLQGQPVEPEVADAPMDGFVRGTARYLLQVAIEAEATAFWVAGIIGEATARERAGATAMNRKRCKPKRDC
jgi:hypothetical protein